RKSRAAGIGHGADTALQLRQPRRRRFARGPRSVRRAPRHSLALRLDLGPASSLGSGADDPYAGGPYVGGGAPAGTGAAPRFGRLAHRIVAPCRAGTVLADSG